MDEEEEMLVQNDVKDPRAGNVSVNLPQLKPDFNQLGDFLYKIGSAKEVNSKRRTLLYNLNKQFKDLSQNVYPLIPDLSSENAKIPRIKVGKEALRKSKEEINFQEKIRIEREEFKKSKKRKLEQTPTEISEHSKKQRTEENGDFVEENDEPIDEGNDSIELNGDTVEDDVDSVEQNGDEQDEIEKVESTDEATTESETVASGIVSL